ncbi:MAG: bile acid:sodium symporter [Bacteroidia bacterium]|nr:bile acid:sodium symporter [Bacteroidia bacterium]
MISFIKNWTLPLAMLTGVLIYLAFAHLDFLQPTKPLVHEIDKILTPGLIFAQLLLAFSKVKTSELHFCKWHFELLGFQLVISLLCATAAIYFNWHPLLFQGALICFICPTATAGAVITAKLGGNAVTLITYTFLVNILTAVFVPLVFPLVNPSDLDFWSAFWIILKKVFPLLIFPFIIAQLLRYCWKSAHAFLNAHAGFAFYIWAVALAMVMGKTVKNIVDDSEQIHIVFLLAIISLVCCFVQYAIGKKIGSKYNDRISAGQAVGQKNTVFAIWMAYTYLQPITSVAPGAYVLWQNTFNSYQLWKARKKR